MSDKRVNVVVINDRGKDTKKAMTASFFELLAVTDRRRVRDDKVTWKLWRVMTEE